MYKDSQKQREYNRERMRRVRGNTDVGNTKEGNTDCTAKSVPYTETVPASYVYGVTGRFLNLPERPRYLTLSDGQVLDRANQPQPNNVIPSMNMCNESRFNYHPTKSLKK